MSQMSASSVKPARDGARRAAPRIFDTDWLVLRRMRHAIGAAAAEVAPGTRAVDFGCGARPYADLFTARGANYIGADFDHGDVAIGPDGALDVATGSVDLVLSFQVLEHVRSLDDYLGEAYRVLRDDGLMLLSTHGSWLFHPHPEDHRRWTAMGLKTDVEARGFEMISCVALVGPLAWTTLMRLTCFAAVLRKLPVVGGALAGLLALVMNVRAWLEDKVTPAWVTRDNACVYLTLSRRVAR